MQTELTTNVRMILPPSGNGEAPIVYTYTVAGLNNAQGVAFDGTHIHIADEDDDNVRMILPPSGNGEAPVVHTYTVAGLNTPFGMTFDGAITSQATLTLSTTDTDIRAGEPVDIEIDSDIDISNFVAADITVTNGTRGALTINSATSATLRVTAGSAGTMTVAIGEDAVDPANVAASQDFTVNARVVATITFDDTTGESGGSTGVNIALSESVGTSLQLSHLTASAGTLSNLTGSGTSWEADLAFPSTGSGTVDIDLAIDSTTPQNAAASASIDYQEPLELAWIVPTVPTDNTFQVTLTSNHELQGVVIGDFRLRIADNSEAVIILDATNATLTAVAGTNNWEIDISLTGTFDADYTVRVRRNSLMFDGMNVPTPALASDPFTIDTSLGVDAVLDITLDATSVETSEIVNATFTYDKAVGDFVAADVTVTTGATKGALTNNGDNTYSMPITAPATGTGTIAVSVAADVVTPGNNSDSASFTYAPPPPEPDAVLDITLDPTTVDNGGIVDATFTFDKVVTNFLAADVNITAGTKGSLTNNGDNTFSMPITAPSAGTGNVIVSVAADAVSPGNNADSASFFHSAPTPDPDAVLDITLDATSAENGEVVNATFTFDIAVGSFVAADVDVTAVATKGALTDNGDNTYSMPITAPATGNGTIQVSVAADVVTPGNNADSASFTYAPPADAVLDITLDATSVENSEIVNALFTYDIAVSGFARNDVQLTGAPGSARGLLVDNGDNTYSMEITAPATGSGTVDVTVAADRVTPGNNADSASFTYAPPTPTNTAPAFANSSYTFDDVGIAVNEVIGTVAATDADNDTLSYSLTGTDADKFDIDADGEITVAEALDYGEAYSINVIADDGTDDTSVSVTINTETVSPRAPTFVVDSVTEDSVTITITAGNDGGESVTDWEYELDGDGTWVSFGDTDLEQTISNLDADTEYSIKVRGINSEGNGVASAAVTATTDAAAVAIPSNLTGTGVQVGSATEFGIGFGGPTSLASDGTTVYMFHLRRGYTLGPTTGVAVQIGGNNLGLSFNPRISAAMFHNNLITVHGTQNDQLYTLDTTTNTLTAIGMPFSIAGSGSSPVVTGITSLNGTVYAAEAFTDSLMTLDIASGVLTPVDGNTVGYGLTSPNIQSLAAYKGRLVAVNIDSNALGIRLVELSTTDGTATAFNNIVPPDSAITGMVEHNDQLLAAGNANDALYRMYDVLWNETIDDLEVDESDNETWSLADISQDGDTFSLPSSPPSWLSVSGADLVATNAPAVTADQDNDVTVRASRSGINVDEIIRIVVKDTGATPPTNTAPAFADASYTFTDVAIAVGTVVGTVAATDADNDTLSYSLAGTDASTFAIDADGEITVAVELTNSEVYSFNVVADDGTDTTSVGVSVTAIAAAITTPSVPLNLSATPQTNGTSVELDWEAPSDNGGASISDYEVSSDDGSTWTAIGSTTTEYTVTGLDKNTEYDFQVRAVNSEGSGTAASVTETTATTAPNAPTGLGVTVGETTANLSWIAPTDTGGEAITSYEVSSDDGSTWTDTGSTDLTYQITGLAADTEYDFKVRAVNSEGSGTASTPVTETTDAEMLTAPGAPTGLSATAETGGTSVELDWTAPTDTGGSPITDYDVSSDNGTTWASTGQTTTTYTLTGLS